MTSPQLTLLEDDLDPDPHRQLERWLADAIEAGERMANAMNLATATAEGVPSARTVLLEKIEPDGFVFQTNTESPKARDLAANSHAALTFFWAIPLRQVRISGTVELLPRAVVEELFAATPLPLQVMLRACRQSQVIPSRAALELSYAEAERSSETRVPADWGAYRLRPETVEFWQGRENRLQDRLKYSRTSEGWRVQRLVP
ncbi:MAG: pyridoxamine 5'-phosphate oxidase [Chloroflexi bacterium]|nr:pyridoxamine 5'-phosphate oxidase [Chloroflexota bacterium]